MFWNYNCMTPSRLDTLLGKDDVTLKQLMDEDDIIQECKAQSRPLLDFLVRPDVLEELVSLIVEEPSGNQEDGLRYKYSNIACELLTCDVPSLNEKVAAEEKLLLKMYAFLQNDSPLNPLLASFFSKTLAMLCCRKHEQVWLTQVMEFIKSKEDFIPLLLKHLGTSAIMDLLLRIINSVQGEDMRKNVLTWLDGVDLVGQIVSLIEPSVDKDIIMNASQLLCDMVKWNREAMYLQQPAQGEEKYPPDPLLNNIESIPQQQPIQTATINGDDDEAKDKSREKSEEEQQQKQIEWNVIQAVIPRLNDFTMLLLDPPQKSAVVLNVGTIDPPLGATRVHIAKLISVLVATNSTEVNEELARLNTVQVLLDLFFKYTWNNFLHTQVEKAFISLINDIPQPMGPSSRSEDTSLSHPLLVNVFSKCHLIQRLLDGWEDNEQEQRKPGGHRRGYMGHITNMCNYIVECSERPDGIGELVEGYITDLPESYAVRWQQLQTSLDEIKNKKYTAKAELHMSTRPSSEADESEYSAQVYQPEEPAVEQALVDYAAQQGVQPCSEQFGFSDHEFTDQEDTISGPLERLSTTTTSLGDLTEDVPNQHLFEKMASEKLTLALSKSEDWEGTGVTFTSTKNDIKMDDAGSSSESSGNNSSDEEGEKEEKQKVWPSDRPPSDDMDIDTDIWSNSPFEVTSSDAVPVAMDTGNPWEASGNGNQVEGWADFETFQEPAAQVQQQPSDNWADFSQLSSTSSPKGEGGWADFSKSGQETVPSNMECSNPEPVSSSESAVMKPKEATEDLSSTVSEVSSSSDVTPQPDSSMDEQDLQENFRFLASQRLLQTSNNEEVETPSSNGPLESHEQSLEAKSAQAEGTASESTVHNGPV